MLENFELFITQNEQNIRVSFFLGIFFTLATLEFIIPRRGLLVSKTKRWFNNIILIFFRYNAN
ncbi:MAG TPA: hypothetical protein EYG93_10040 [Sulfurospirillum arcachonense]|nr:hypothetical protein [Sulfurospirillum arcachonense]HIP45649.1 hypothetical protein [Sulfurospirillum arcachonense]